MEKENEKQRGTHTRHVVVPFGWRLFRKGRTFQSLRMFQSLFFFCQQSAQKKGGCPDSRQKGSTKTKTMQGTRIHKTPTSPSQKAKKVERTNGGKKTETGGRKKKSRIGRAQRRAAVCACLASGGFRRLGPTERKRGNGNWPHCARCLVQMPSADRWCDKRDSFFFPQSRKPTENRLAEAKSFFFF